MSDHKRQLSGGVMQDLARQVQLILRLMSDGRVPWYLKALPAGSLIYLIFPDLAPGPIDDALVVWIGATLFIELCPPDVVQEHRDALTKVIPGTWKDAPPEESDDVEMIEGHARDL